MKKTIETTTIIAISHEDVAEVLGYLDLTFSGFTLPDRSPGNMNQQPYNTEPVYKTELRIPRYR